MPGSTPHVLVRAFGSWRVRPAGPYDMSTIRDTVRSVQGDGRGWTLLTLAVGWFAVSGFRVVLPALLPQIKTTFGVSNASAGFALTVLWLTYAAMQFPAGTLADRTGERLLLISGVSLGAASLVVFFLSPVFALFLGACAAFGIGAGLYGTPRDMLLSRTYEGAANTAYTVTFAAGSLGGAVLPFAGTWIAERFDWRIALASLLPLYLLVVGGLWRFVPRSPASNEATGPSARETARRTLRALDNRTLALGSVAMIVFIFTYQAFTAFLPTYLVEIKGMAPSVAAGLFGLMFVFGALVQPGLGGVADRYGERVTLAALIAVSALTLLALPFTGRGLVLTLLVPLLGIRVAIAPLLSAFLVRELPEAVRGTGWGLLRTSFFAIGATGSSVMGLFADAGLFDAGFVFLAGLTAIILGVWLLVPVRAA
jgi:predicted MFS family arabinose efflux permease